MKQNSTSEPGSDVTIVKRIVNGRLWGSAPLTLVDVGASGGIAPAWAAFEPLMTATGFDPLVAEVVRLQALETRPHVRYEAAFVGCAPERRVPPPMSSIRVDPYLRSSANRAQELIQHNYIEQNFNSGAPVEWSERQITLDSWFSNGASLDVLKVDTDGSDLQVLYGAERLLREGAFLAIRIETQFQGWPHKDANVFANIDRVLRGAGFSLWDITFNRYSRSALPARFASTTFAKTRSGQLLAGESLFMRDLAHPDYQKLWSYGLTAERVVKQIALFDFFGFPDCAAELILACRWALPSSESTALLDLLVQSARESGSYESFVQRFEANPRAWLSSRGSVEARSGGPGDSLEAYRRKLETAQQHIKSLKKRVARWRSKAQGHAKARCRSRSSFKGLS